MSEEALYTLHPKPGCPTQNNAAKPKEAKKDKAEAGEASSSLLLSSLELSDTKVCEP